MDPKQIEHQFTYHDTKPGQLERYQDIRSAGHAMALIICANTPEGPDQTVAIRKLREAVMTANAAIACETAEETEIALLAAEAFQAGEIPVIQANAFVDILTKIKGLFGTDQVQKMVTDFVTLLTSEMMPLAMDAVNVVEAKMKNAKGSDKRNAAVAEFKTQAASAGHNLENFALSALNCFIEVALQMVLKDLATKAITLAATADNATTQAAGSV